MGGSVGADLDPLSEIRTRLTAVKDDGSTIGTPPSRGNPKRRIIPMPV